MVQNVMPVADGELPDTQQGDWAVRLMALSEGIDRELASPDDLAALADRLIAVAAGLGATTVTGASQGGERLAGAMAVRSAGQVRLLDGVFDGRPVLIVETLLATGTQMLTTARALRADGAERVVGVAVLADQTGLEITRRELGDDVVTLGTI
jgi:orotate phosphoribosyltransferase